MTATDQHRDAPSWRDELRRPAPSPSARCSCGHTRAAHTGRAIAERDQLGRPTTTWLSEPDSCSLMRCGCELFRGEADR